MPALVIKSKGKEYLCLYDEEDQDLISHYHWFLDSHGYACSDSGGRRILMHRLICGVLDRPEVEVDHRYHNRVDNRRSKLRICTRAQNARNRLKSLGHSKFKGVFRERGKWHSQINFENRKLNLGRYYSETVAAQAYDRVARKVFGEFAWLNFPESVEIPQLTIQF